MNYTDGAFLLFFALTFGLYYTLRDGRLQVALLVAASLFFYAWESPGLLAVFLVSWFISGTSSHAVLRAADAGDARRARGWAVAGVVANLALLGFFKYKFLVLGPTGAHGAPASLGEWLLLAPLPIGISFYTFHGISLLVDVWRGGHAALAGRARHGWLQHMLDTLLYLVFFPQLIAGPIIKAKDFYPQVGPKRLADVDWMTCLRILVTGYFLKCVVADNLAEQTFWVAYPHFLWRPSADLLLMLYGYSAQIFADYAGYSLIAIGLARLLGYRLPDNFNFPYVSSSIGEFWRRWNMSLSSWLRDYLYIPLGGSRHGEVRTYLNLIIVMFVGGLWHGAAWSFAVWGLWHGIGLALERPWLDSRFMRSRHPLAVGLRRLLVFHFVTLGWLFFKLQDFGHAWAYLRALFAFTPGVTPGTAYYVVLFALPVAVYHAMSLRAEPAPHQPIRLGLRHAALGAMLALIALNAGPMAPFIYFQF